MLRSAGPAVLKPSPVTPVPSTPKPLPRQRPPEQWYTPAQHPNEVTRPTPEVSPSASDEEPSPPCHVSSTVGQESSSAAERPRLTERAPRKPLREGGAPRRHREDVSSSPTPRREVETVKGRPRRMRFDATVTEMCGDRALTSDESRGSARRLHRNNKKNCLLAATSSDSDTLFDALPRRRPRIIIPADARRPTQ